MELEKFNKAKEIKELHDSVGSAYNALCVKRDFHKVHMKILLEEYDELYSKFICIPNKVAYDVIASIRCVLKSYEWKLKDEFNKL